MPTSSSKRKHSLLGLVVGCGFLITIKTNGTLGLQVLRPVLVVNSFSKGIHRIYHHDNRYELNYRHTRLFAGVGSDGNNNLPPRKDDNGSNSGNNNWDDFLNLNYKESENMRKAREYMSENSLPISFDNNDDDVGQIVDDNNTNNVDEVKQSSSALTRRDSDTYAMAFTSEAIINNPYIGVVSKLTPSELISKFTASAHPRVQNAVRTTILGMLGGLQKMSIETTTITTGQRLASLMFQLQMTGYMFKNADYRMSLQQSLGLEEKASMSHDLTGLFLKGSNESIDPLAGTVRGKITVKYSTERPDSSNENDKLSSSPIEIEVDAAAYMSELRSEVAKLRDELVLIQKKQDETANKDLLTFIRTLPPGELQGLTSTMSSDVVVAMKALVNAVMAGIGDGLIGPDTVTEQSAESMAQLCMWQLAIGYNLRTLEVREQMKKSLNNNFAQSTDDDDDVGGIDFSQIGVLE